MKSAGPILGALRARALSAQAAVKAPPRARLARQEPQVSRLPNGAIVASLENNSPVSRLAIAYNAGARFETGDTAGITHFLRSAGGLSSKSGTSGFAITKNVQQIGGSLTCTTTREHILYSLDCTRDQVDTGFEYLSSAASGPVGNPWESVEAMQLMKLDLSFLEHQPHARMMEAVHRAAFKNSLGRSIYSAADRIGTHSSDMLQHFINKHYTSGNVAMVGVGISHDKLMKLAKKAGLTEGKAPEMEKALYLGGECRIDSRSPLVHAAVVTQGANLSSNDLVSLCVLQQAMGTGSSVKYADNITGSKVAKAAAQATSNPFAASCINASYSDSGLFGFQIVADKNDAGNVIKSVMAVFADATKGNLSEADVKRAKQQLKAKLHFEYEDSMVLLEDMSVQALVSGQIMSVTDIGAAIDKITAADLAAVAKRVINGKPAMGAVGNLDHTPYLEELL